MILKVLIILISLCSMAQAESIYYFTGPNCAPCATFKKQVLADKEIQALMRKFDAAFMIDVSRHPNITKYYNIASMPTVIIVRREEKYEQGIGKINRTSTVKTVSSWPLPGVNFTDKQAFIRLLKDNLKNQLKGQTQDDSNIIRKF